MSRAKEIQRQIEERDLTFMEQVKSARTKTLSNLAILQELAVRELHDSEKQREIGSMSEPQKASANAVWIRSLMPYVNEILLMTGGTIKFSGTFFGRSLIDCKIIEKEDEKRVALVFGAREIPAGSESAVIEDAWQNNFREERRNIQALAKLTPLEVIGKAYSAVYRI